MAQDENDIGDQRLNADGTLAESAGGPSLLERFHDWLHRLFGSRRDVWVGSLALVFTAVVFSVTIKDAVYSKYKDKTGVTRIIPLRWNQRTLVFPIDGVDKAGRRVLFDVVVLTKDYGWVIGSTEDLMRGDTRLTPADIETEVLAPQMREGLAKASALIAVGVASQEGAVGAETRRADLRANRTAKWLRGIVDPNMAMWTLNLGRYVEPCQECEDPDTSWQRPFIVIAVRKADAGADIGEALRIAMSDKENLPSPERYSSFVLAKYTK